MVRRTLKLVVLLEVLKRLLERVFNSSFGGVVDGFVLFLHDLVQFVLRFFVLVSYYARWLVKFNILKILLLLSYESLLILLHFEVI